MTAAHSPRLPSDVRRTPVLRAAVIALACGSAMACSAILKPKDDVERCGSADDCSGTGDNRYVSLCKFDDDHADLDSTKIDKICVADFDRSRSCDPDGSATGEAVKNNFKATFDDPACLNIGCADENRGKVGCAPSQDGCAGGLVFNEDLNVCEDPDADVPIIPVSYLNDNDLDGQHIKDQFCKSYFCDDTFVCNASTSKCQPCDPEKDYGEGGCGLVYAEGAIAKVYVLGDDLTSQCEDDAPSVSFNDPAIFGACG